MPDDRGVLRTRLETLTSAMKKVGEAVETARQRAAGLRRANELLLEMLAPIGNVDRLVSDLGRAHDLGFLDLDEDEVKRVDGEFFEVLTRSADDVRSIWQKVMETRRTLQSIQDGMVNLSGDRKRIGDKIKIEIDQKCATVTSKIEQLTERLDEEGKRPPNCGSSTARSWMRPSSPCSPPTSTSSGVSPSGTPRSTAISVTLSTSSSARPFLMPRRCPCPRTRPPSASATW